MAAPSHAPNAATMMVTIFDADGNTMQMSRLNAIDMVRSGDYFWKSNDVKAERPEEDGPADPSATEATVYNAEGEPFTVDMANARDMVRSMGYTWNPPVSEENAASDGSSSEGETDDASEDDQTSESNSDAETSEASESGEAVSTDFENGDASAAPSAGEIDLDKEPLAAQALRVAGNDDVVAYLEGFSEDALRDMAVRRYDEKIHHRSGKETIISKMVEFENARLVGDDQADA